MFTETAERTEQWARAKYYEKNVREHKAGVKEVAWFVSGANIHGRQLTAEELGEYGLHEGQSNKVRIGIMLGRYGAPEVLDALFDRPGEYEFEEDVLARGGISLADAVRIVEYAKGDRDVQLEGLRALRGEADENGVYGQGRNIEAARRVMQLFLVNKANPLYGEIGAVEAERTRHFLRWLADYQGRKLKEVEEDMALLREQGLTKELREKYGIDRQQGGNEEALTQLRNEAGMWRMLSVGDWESDRLKEVREAYAQEYGGEDEVKQRYVEDALATMQSYKRRLKTPDIINSLPEEKIKEYHGATKKMKYAGARAEVHEWLNEMRAKYARKAAAWRKAYKAMHEEKDREKQKEAQKKIIELGAPLLEEARARGYIWEYGDPHVSKQIGDARVGAYIAGAIMGDRKLHFESQLWEFANYKGKKPGLKKKYDDAFFAKWTTDGIDESMKMLKNPDFYEREKIDEEYKKSKRAFFENYAGEKIKELQAEEERLRNEGIEEGGNDRLKEAIERKREEYAHIDDMLRTHEGRERLETAYRSEGEPGEQMWLNESAAAYGLRMRNAHFSTEENQKADNGLLGKAWNDAREERSYAVKEEDVVRSVESLKKVLNEKRKTKNVYTNAQNQFRALLSQATIRKSGVAMMSRKNLAYFGIDEEAARVIHYTAAAHIGELFENARSERYFEGDYKNTKGREGAHYLYSRIDVPGYGAFDVKIIATQPKGKGFDPSLYNLELTIESPVSRVDSELIGTVSTHSSTGLPEHRLAAYRSNVEHEILKIREEAIKNGTFMKAPNGEDSKLDEWLWGLVRTRAFKDWFGDWENDPENASKVVDENGEPLVVWHGSDEEFSVFDRTRGRENMDIQGLFFLPGQIKSVDNRGTFDGGNPNIHFSLGGERAATYGEMEAAGLTYYDPADGKRKFALPTAGVRLKENFTPGELNVPDKGHKDVSLAALLHYPELFRAYPELGNMRVRLYKEKGTGVRGFYAPNGTKPKEGAYIALNMAHGTDPERVLNTLLHESQHAIQHHEGWARGAGDMDRKGALKYVRKAMAERKKQGLESDWAKENMSFLTSLHTVLMKGKGQDLQTAITAAYWLSHGEQEARYAGERLTETEGGVPRVTGVAASTDTIAVLPDKITELGGITFGNAGIYARLMESRLAPVGDFQTDRRLYQIRESAVRYARLLNGFTREKDKTGESLLLEAQGVAERAVSLLPNEYRVELEPYRVWLSVFAEMSKGGFEAAAQASAMVPMRGWGDLLAAGGNGRMPDCYLASGDSESGVALAVNGNLLPLAAAGSLNPAFSGVQLAHVHRLLCIALVGNQQGQTGVRVLFIPTAHEPYDMGSVEVIPLLPVGTLTPQFQQRVNEPAMDGFFSMHAVVVPVEEAGITLFLQQNERIRRWLEPVRHWGFKGLPRLRIVIVHESNGKGGVRLHKRPLHESPQVKISPLLRGLVKIEVQRYVKKVHLLLGFIEEKGKLTVIIFPAFANSINFALKLLSHTTQEVCDKIARDMLHGIHSEAVQMKFPYRPFSPARNFLHHFRMLVIHVVKHEVIIIAFFAIYVVAPPLPLSFNFKNSSLVATRVVVNPGKMIPMPFKVRVLLTASGECEVCPPLDFVGITKLLVTIFLPHAFYVKVFFLISPSFVVENGIEIYLDMLFMERFDHMIKLRTCAVLSAHRSLLVKLPKVIKIISGIAHAAEVCRLIGGRNPNRSDTDLRQVLRIFRKLLPKQPIVGQIPLKILHHDSVFHAHENNPAKCEEQEIRANY